MLTDIEIITAVVSNSGYPGAFKHWENIVKTLEPKTCSSCKWRINNNCSNAEKIKEKEFLLTQNEENIDKLIYSFDDGGSFQVGPNFGCIHHEVKNE
jgi:hypothetical protein